MIKISNVSVKYKNISALKNVSLEIRKGDILALVGKNGAGKSTLLKIIAGLITNFSGSREFSGKIGWMSEDAKPDPLLTVKEYLNFIGGIKGLSGSLLSESVSRALSEIDIENFKEVRCGKLSKGIRQRVLLASAILGISDLLVLDEPSAGLDPLFQIQMMNIIKSLSGERTIILSTHNISEIENLATKILVLKEGICSYSGNYDKGTHYYDYF